MACKSRRQKDCEKVKTTDFENYIKNAQATKKHLSNGAFFADKRTFLNAMLGFLNFARRLVANENRGKVPKKVFSCILYDCSL